MNIKYQIRGLDKVRKYIKGLPRGTTKTAMQAIAEYLIGDSSHGLKHYERYKYVSRKSAYGFTFFTDKQRRWFFANKMYEKIGNRRTGASADGWTMKATDGGYGYILTNSTMGAYYTRSDSGQARQPAKVGWRTVTAVITANIKGAIRSANSAVKEFLKSKG